MIVNNKKTFFLLVILLSSIIFLSCQSQNETDDFQTNEGIPSPMESSTPNPTVTPVPTSTLSPSETPTPTVELEGDEGDVKIMVYKGARRLELWKGLELIGEYPIGLGFTPEGHKEKEGDGKTPEGNYYVCTRNDKSKFYLSLGVSYPSISDAKRGLEVGLITSQEHDEIIEAINSKRMPPWNTNLGGEIMIHGHGSHSDWTEGCIAVDDDIMDILWENCELGTTITIHQ